MSGEEYAARDPEVMRHESGAHFRSNSIRIRRSRIPMQIRENRALCFQSLTHSIFSKSCAFKQLRIPRGRGTPISKPRQIMTFQTRDRRTYQHACAEEPSPRGARCLRPDFRVGNPDPAGTASSSARLCVPLRLCAIFSGHPCPSSLIRVVPPSPFPSCTYKLRRVPVRSMSFPFSKLQTPGGGGCLEAGGWKLEVGRTKDASLEARSSLPQFGAFNCRLSTVDLEVPGTPPELELSP